MEIDKDQAKEVVKYITDYFIREKIPMLTGLYAMRSIIKVVEENAGIQTGLETTEKELQ